VFSKLALESFALSTTFKTIAGLKPHSKPHISFLGAVLAEKKVPYKQATLEKGTRVLMCNVLFNEDFVGDTRPIYLKSDISSLVKAKDSLASMHRKMRANLIEFELKEPVVCLETDGVHHLHLSVLEKKDVLSIPDTIKELESMETAPKDYRFGR